VLLRGLILDLIDDGTVPTARSRLHGVLNEDRQDTNDRVRRSCGIGSEAVLLQVVVVNAGDEVTCLRLRRRKGAVRTTKDAIVIDGGCSYYMYRVSSFFIPIGIRARILKPLNLKSRNYCTDTRN